MHCAFGTSSMTLRQVLLEAVIRRFSSVKFSVSKITPLGISYGATSKDGNNKNKTKQKQNIHNNKQITKTNKKQTKTKTKQ
jgi:hypothetical protein